MKRNFRIKIKVYNYLSNSTQQILVLPGYVSTLPTAMGERLGKMGDVLPIYKRSAQYSMRLICKLAAWGVGVSRVGASVGTAVVLIVKRKPKF